LLLHEGLTAGAGTAAAAAAVSAAAMWGFASTATHAYQHLHSRLRMHCENHEYYVNASMNTFFAMQAAAHAQQHLQFYCPAGNCLPTSANAADAMCILQCST
jgi:hypothetical protein